MYIRTLAHICTYMYMRFNVLRSTDIMGCYEAIGIRYILSEDMVFIFKRNIAEQKNYLLREFSMKIQ